MQAPFVLTAVDQIVRCRTADEWSGSSFALDFYMPRHSTVRCRKIPDITAFVLRQFEGRQLWRSLLISPQMEAEGITAHASA